MYQHIAVCPMCAETFNILKSLNRELEDLPAVTPPVSLVDAIMPRLDAIDRDRQNLVVPPALKSQEPAEMMPEMRRPRRAGSWWSTIGGRTAIGAAAAVLILGVAIFNNEPKMLSDAELPYEEASTTSAGTNDESAATQNQEMAQPFAAEGGTETGGESNDGNDSSASLRSSPSESSPEANSDPAQNDTKATQQPSDAANGTNKDVTAPDKPVQMKDVGEPQAPDQPATSNNEVPKPIPEVRLTLRRKNLSRVLKPWMSRRHLRNRIPRLRCCLQLAILPVMRSREAPNHPTGHPDRTKDWRWCRNSGRPRMVSTEPRWRLII